MIMRPLRLIVSRRELYNSIFTQAPSAPPSVRPATMDSPLTLQSSYQMNSGYKIPVLGFGVRPPLSSTAEIRERHCWYLN